MRAVAIRVQPDSMVAGFVIPRSHVDVMCTVRTNDGSTTYTILENMEILAVDTKSAREGEAAAVVGTTVTLAASPEDCNLLKMAAGTGVLDLALRGIGDDKSTKPQAVTQKFLENPRAREGTDDKETTTVAQGKTKVPSLPLVPPGTATPPPAPVELAPKEPEPEVFVMTIINGPTIEKVRFTKKPGDTWPVEATTTKTPTATPAPGSAPVSAPASAPAAAPEPKANPPENKATRPETRKQPG
jgi:Flp pilus assembly protein CpaB